MPSNRCVACLLITTTGRILVQYELNAALPFQYPQLALLVASLVQFSQTQEFAQLELSDGFTLVIRSDAISQLSCVVICKTPLASEKTKKSAYRALDMAHLKSLVILSEFLRCFRDQVDAIFVESKANSEQMAEKYTLTSALGGGSRRHRDGVDVGDNGGGGGDDDGTMDIFMFFQNEFIAPIMEDNSTKNICTNISDSVTKAPVPLSSVEITRQFLMNADTGNVLYSLMRVPKLLSGRHWYHEESLATQKLLRRVAQALGKCCSILQRTDLLTREQEDSQIGFSHISNVTSTTVVLRIGGTGETQRNGSLANGPFHIAVQMLGAGTFASVVFFYGSNERFLGHSNQLVRSGDLQRALISDPRGSQFLRLVQDGALASEFQLHIGSDGAPEDVLQALENVVAPWTKVYDEEQSTSLSRSASMVR